MKLPVEWLNEYLERPLKTAVMADALERAGVEVEEVIAAPRLAAGIVVGEVEEVRPHPNADRLQVAVVNAGRSGRADIVCGAPNLAAGQRVAVALPGAVLPDGTEIARASLRGVESAGMICSQRELGLGEDHQGILVLPADAPIGSQLTKYLASTDVIDTTTASNRADLNGLIWLAQEVAAHSNQTAKLPPSLLPSHDVINTADLPVTIREPKLAPRYQLAHLEVDPAQPSPVWLQQRLQAVGVRSVNVVVDITNYVMFESGQPLHAFDAARVTLPINVRRAKAGERLTTLDGQSRKLDRSDLLIADAKGAIGLAGVMGGANSQITTQTTEIYLESATFDGSTLRRTAARHGLRTDASARFERGLPLELPPVALERAIQLLTELAGGRLVAGPIDVLSNAPRQPIIVVQVQAINALLGISLQVKQMEAELAKLSFKTSADAEALEVVPPWWRPDIRHQADVAEEVMKLVGYDKLPATLPSWAPRTAEVSFDRHWPPLWQAKTTLRSSGLTEVVNYSFISAEQITELGRDPKRFLKLANPLSVEQAYLRTDLLPSLLRTAVTNRTYRRQFGLFEFSKVYLPQKSGSLPIEPLRLGALMRTPSNSYSQIKAVLDRLSREFNVPITIEPGGVESAVAHPTRSANLTTSDRQPLGWIGQLHPRLVAASKLGGEVGYLEFDWSTWLAVSKSRIYRQPNRFPAIERDISLIVSRQLTWQQVERMLSSQGFAASFVNDYYGEDLPKTDKVLTVRLSFSDPDRTLTDSEANDRLKQALAVLNKHFTLKLRD